MGNEVEQSSAAVSSMSPSGVANPYRVPESLDVEQHPGQVGVLAFLFRWFALILTTAGAWLAVFMVGTIPILTFLGHLEALLMVWAFVSIPIAMMVVAIAVHFSRRRVLDSEH